jgi:hypothetical protein
MVIASFDPLTGSLASPSGSPPFRAVTLVAPPAAAATAPAVRWVAGWNEWWVTWIDERQTAVLRRLSADGSAVAPAIQIGPASLASIRLSDVTIGIDAGSAALPTAYLVRPDQSTIDQVSFGCTR